MRPHRPTRAQWAEARALYEDDGLEAHEVAAKVRIHVRTVRQYIRLQEWRSFYDPAPPPDDAAKFAARTIASRRAMLRRLCRLIDIKLKLMERRMKTQMDLPEGQEPSAADHERDARCIASLAKQLEQAKEMQADLERVAGGLPATPADAELFAEADRVRAEIAERLARFVPTDA